MLSTIGISDLTHLKNVIFSHVRVVSPKMCLNSLLLKAAGFTVFPMLSSYQEFNVDI